MITFRQEIEINKPLDTVIQMFRDRSQLIKWQPGLVSSERQDSNAQATYKLVFQLGRRQMPMVETIVKDQLPIHYEVEYAMKGIVNRTRSSFESMSSGQTRWICDQEFRFKGIMRLVVVFIKSDLERQSYILMKNFKGYLESLS